MKKKKKPEVKSNFEINLNKIQLSVDQSLAYEKIQKNDIIFLNGEAGSGKTYLACYAAIKDFLDNKIRKIILTRPTVSKEKIGYLPGDINEKLDPWISPIFHNFSIIVGQDFLDNLIEKNYIEIVPIAFMRGRTFVNSFIICDEFQNVTDEQMKMVLTRLGVDSKMVICSDLKQIDLSNKNDVGLLKIIDAKIPGMEVINLKGNHRHRIVEDIINYYNTRKI